MLCNIYIYEQDISKINAKNVRKEIAIVSQDIQLISGTIRDNLLIANPTATDKDLEKVLKDVDAYHFVDKLPMKLDTLIGENKVRLSGGEKQRIALAQAILSNKKNKALCQIVWENNFQ